MSITILPLNFNNTKVMQSNISHNPLSHPVLFLKRRIQAYSWRRVFHQIQKYILSLLSTSILPWIFFYNSGFLLSNPYTERNTWRIEFEVTGKWSASWQEHWIFFWDYNPENLDRTRSTDVKLVSIRLKKLFPSKRSTHVFTFFRPRNRPRTLPFFSFPLWWFAWRARVLSGKLLGSSSKSKHKL